MEAPLARRTTDGPRKIHPAIRTVWLVSNLVSFTILAVISSVMEFALLKAVHAPWRFPIFMPIFWVGMGIASAALLKLRWETWRYEVTDQEVILSWGVWNQTRRFVPRDRIQHVDITSGPLARRLGLSHVHLYVAGAHGDRKSTRLN